MYFLGFSCNMALCREFYMNHTFFNLFLLQLFIPLVWETAIWCLYHIILLSWWTATWMSFFIVPDLSSMHLWLKIITRWLNIKSVVAPPFTFTIPQRHVSKVPSLWCFHSTLSHTTLLFGDSLKTKNQIPDRFEFKSEKHIDVWLELKTIDYFIMHYRLPCRTC